MPHQGGRDDGNVSPRVGRELTVQSVAVQGETGARIASSSASASKVTLKTFLPVLNPFQVAPVTLFLETAPAPQGTQGHSVSCLAQIKPLERVASKGVLVPTGTIATMSQEDVSGASRTRDWIVSPASPDPGASQTPGDLLAGRTAPAQPRAQLSAQERMVAVSAKQTSAGKIAKSIVRSDSMETVAFLLQSMRLVLVRPRCSSATLSVDVFVRLASTVGLRPSTR